MKTIIRVNVPKHQIGQEVTVYFKDTMTKKGKCEPDIVHCKDCRYYNEKPDSHGDRCDKIHWSRSEDWYCADGVERDD